MIAALVVFIGTLAPLVNDALGMQADFRRARLVHAGRSRSWRWRWSVLVSIGIHSAWKRGQLGRQRRRLCIGAGIALVLGVGAGTGASMVPATGAPSSASCSARWIIVSSLFDPIDRLRRKLTLPRAIVGMTIAHMGLGVCVIAVSTVEAYTIERDVALGPGETVALGSYAYRFDKLEPVEGPNYDGVRAEITVLRDGLPVAVLHPEKRTTGCSDRA